MYVVGDAENAMGEDHRQHRDKVGRVPRHQGRLEDAPGHPEQEERRVMTLQFNHAKYITR